nr:cupin domain-containing protein [Leucobacter chromiireducens]
MGRRVAESRELRGLSLRALAAAAGVSSSFLSQLENGRTNASVASLRKIAAALGVTPAHLLDASNGHTRGVLRGTDRPTLPLDGAQKYVISQEPLRNLEIYSGTFAPGGSTGPDLYSHGNAQEFLIVVAGAVTLELAGERYTMQKDDSIEFLSSVPHRIVNDSEVTAEVLWINSPPTGAEEVHPAQPRTVAD